MCETSVESETSSEGWRLQGAHSWCVCVCVMLSIYMLLQHLCFFPLSPPLLISDLFTSSSSFHRNMVKSFYTSSLLLDVLSVFGELSEEVRSQTIQKDKQMS